MSSRVSLRLVSLLFIMSWVRSAVSQEAAVGTLELDKIVAGRTFQLKVKFATAPSYSGFVQVVFDYKPQTGIRAPQNPVVIACNGTTKAGETEVDLPCPVPIDADGGVYTHRDIRLGPPTGFSRERTEKISIPDFEVLPVQDTTVYPASAVATISFDQQQVLENGAGKVQALLDQLNTKVDNNSAETPALKIYLATVAEIGQKELQRSRAQYLQSSPKGSPEPIFFEDFARHYAAMLVEIRAPQNAHLQNGHANLHFQLVQLSTSQTVTVHPTPLTGNLGPLVSKLAELLGNHMAAFLMIAKDSSTKFIISLKSSPPGAAISYKRLGEEYADWTEKTDIDRAEFPYALWTFRFSMGKCEVVKNPNPYIEKSPNLNVSMQNCQKK
jgi:hypothetical protein